VTGSTTPYINPTAESVVMIDSDISDADIELVEDRRKKGRLHLPQRLSRSLKNRALPATMNECCMIQSNQRAKSGLQKTLSDQERAGATLSSGP
jgi:hypothetical protein